MKKILLLVLLSAAGSPTFAQPGTTTHVPQAAEHTADSIRAARAAGLKRSAAQMAPVAAPEAEPPEVITPAPEPPPRPTDPWKPFMGGLLVGALFGGLVVAWWINQQLARAPVPATPQDLQDKLTLAEVELARLRQENKEYRHVDALAKLKTQRSRDTRESPPAAPARPPAPTSPAPPPPPERMTVGETVTLPVEPAPPPAPSTHYAPATETNFIEDRLLNPYPLEHLPIELTEDPGNPQRALFKLNPRVDQALIIGDGVGRLGEFFAFERPDKVRSLRAGPAGELRREQGGWRVVKKAGLVLS